MDIRKIATQSAYTYYEYAMCQEKGNIEYTVRRIIETDLFFELHLSSAIPSADNLKVKIHDSILEEEQVRIMEYNDEKRTVLLLPSPEYRRILQTCSIFDIVLVANVRFLIKRIEDWYNQYGHQLALPTKKPSVLPYEPRQIQETPSQDQMAAIQGVFKSPLSYIWGAPGTGKTQYVLARCLLAYIKRGKKVLITAPTNHALEQILYGVLPILESVDIPTEKVLRLGIPTAEFMQKHPHVCENHHLQLKLFQIQEQIKTAKIRLEQLQKQVTKQNRHQNYITARKDFEEFVNCANAPLDQLSQLFKEYKKHEENIRFYNVKQNHYRQELINADRKIEQTKKDLFILDKKLTKFKKGLLAYFFQTKIEKLQNNHKLTLSALNAFEKEKNKLEEKQLQNKTQTDFEVKEQQENSKQQESIIDNLQASADILLNLHLLKTISFPQNKDIYSAFCNAIQKGVELFEEKEREYADMPPYNAQETISEMHSATKQLEQLEQELNQFSYIQNERLNKCLVMATTIDGYLTRILPDGDFQPEHIFLDEAGYAPLIKAAALTAFGCPLTLLGDHMQLPPVCEMNDEKFNEPEYAPVVLFAQSALYLEDLFSLSFEEVHQRYMDHLPPFFEKLQKFDLLHSYRFGHSLASVLAGEVYSGALKGSDTQQTDIFFIHSPNNPSCENKDPALKRYNPAECEAIAKFVKQNDDLEIGIITPYKNQRNALRKRIKDSIEVNTVHGSQGREWDCVIFSVVDTTDPWFTNSLLPKSNGKKVVNTAVSRARKQLILVCDANYWKSKENQLIGKLLSVAQEIKL